MSHIITVKSDENSIEQISIPPSVGTQLGMSGSEKRNLRFGQNTICINFVINPDLKQNEAQLSIDCIEELNIPLIPQYELRHSGGEVVVGPYIGILAAYTEHKLIKKFQKLFNYVKYYDHFNGAVLIFSLEGVNKQKKVITGYIFDPINKSWEKGTYSYPSSIYRRVTMNKQWRKHFEDNIGQQFYNYKNLSKWVIYQLLNESKDLKKYLPHTILYQEPDDVISHLKVEKTAFIKPITGLKGINIKEIEQDGNGYFVRFRANKENRILRMTERELRNYLFTTLFPKRYIVQQKLNLVFDHNRVVDFRLFVTKDQTGKWNSLGWISRSGMPSSIVSNRSSGGTVGRGDDTLKRIFNVSEDELTRRRTTIFQVALKACRCFDRKKMNFGYFAIDIGIDVAGRVWIIEMNHRRPNDALPLYIGDQHLYDQIKYSNMLYLKYLAGYSTS